MARKVVWAYAPTEDLEAAAEYIYRDSHAYAAAFVSLAMEISRSLCDFAERGRIVPEFEDKQIREIFVQSYRLIYRIEDSQVIILALIHGRRDLRTAWNERKR